MTTLWYVPNLGRSYSEEDFRVLADPEVANLEGSQNEDGTTHSIVLDLDGPHRYRPSSTPGHGHLIVDTSIPWKEYETLLKLLAKVGMIEPGYLKMSLARGGSFVRREGVKKDNVAP